MPPRRAPTSRSLPGGASETTFQLEGHDNVRRSPVAPRRRTGTRQPIGDDNTGAEPSPRRTRRRQYQEPPTPSRTPAAPPEIPQHHMPTGQPSGTPSPTPRQSVPRPRIPPLRRPVASGSRTVPQNNQSAPRGRHAPDLFDADSDNEGPPRRQNVRFEDETESFGPSPPPSPSPSPPPVSTPSQSRRQSRGRGTPRGGGNAPTPSRSHPRTRRPSWYSEDLSRRRTDVLQRDATEESLSFLPTTACCSTAHASDTI
ncbi:hypothetical protein B0H16DRAFT_752473 [Mycena metata]|uniref:Uncharacterized protein n=1 Tax=Mycena metata TaxID=1033252 RepID=A0AAD7DZH1_9AGAR|nr:hypothetical protein B0H16DRAFT_752473 [Mycena metata]